MATQRRLGLLLGDAETKQATSSMADVIRTDMVRVSLLAAMLLVACKQKEPPPPAPQPTATLPSSKAGAPVMPGTLRRTSVKSSYAVALPAGMDATAVEKLARGKSKNVEVTRVSVADMFNNDQLTFMTKDLPPSDAEAVKGAGSVLRLSVSGNDVMKLPRELAEVTRDVADAAHGWVLDPATVRIHPAAGFRDHVPGDRPDVRKLIMVHSIAGGNEQPFFDTAGLRRYGFPELYVAEAATSNLSQVTHLLNGAAQTLLDGGDVNDRGEIAIDFHKLGWDLDIIEKGTGKAVLKARWARERDAHDDDELVVELVPVMGEGTEGMARVITECFGSKSEQTVQRDADDAELLAAARRARADLEKLRAHFAKGIPVGEQLTVKAKFTGGEGQVEWMWVDVAAFQGTTFQGTLANDPEAIDSLRDGQKVKVNLADVGDYLHEVKGGPPAGGYSIEVLTKRETPDP